MTTIKLPEPWRSRGIQAQLRDGFMYGSLDKVVIVAPHNEQDVRDALEVGDDNLIRYGGVRDAPLIVHKDAGWKVLHVIERELYEGLIRG